jgi:hypothetical protein
MQSDYLSACRPQDKSKMRKIAIIFLLLSLTSCNLPPAGMNVPPPKAVYFVLGPGQLSSQDLQSHPEIVVVHTFAAFKQAASRKTALWIDQSATPFDSDEAGWINAAPQMDYPIVLVGTSDMLHAFKGLLRICCFAGPAGDYPGMDAPGFSVSQNGSNNSVGFDQGYNQKPTVPAILAITNALLAGKLTPAPTVPFVPGPSPTP